jgi:hypothetical protein
MKVKKNFQTAYNLTETESSVWNPHAPADGFASCDEDSVDMELQIIPHLS